MRADDLDQAMDYVNETGYGLTSGLESLDVREQKAWKAGIKAGNLYVNRGTTGAIVLRQPFGGVGKSALGPGIKAGGPNYVTQFMNITETGMPRVGAIHKKNRMLATAQMWMQQVDWGRFPDIGDDIRKAVRAVESYLYHAQHTFNREKDYFHLRGQDNILRYLPVGTIMVRLHTDDTVFDTLARIAATIIARSQPLISLPPDLDNSATAFLFGRQGEPLLEGATVLRQTDEEVIAYF